MALDSPSSPQQTPPSSDAEDYPVWKRWGDIDEHNESRESDEGESSSDQKVAWERLKAQLRANGGAAGDAPSTPTQRPNGHSERPAAKGEPLAKSKHFNGGDEDASLRKDSDRHSAVSDTPARDFRSWEADFSALDIRDRVVIMLLFKQVVQIDEVEAAWRRFQKTNQGRSREPLWRILARDPAFDRNRILAEAAKSAGYETAHIDPTDAAAFIDAQFNAFSEGDWERMLTLNVVPIAKEEDSRSGRSRWVFVSPDPTRPGVSNLLRDLRLGGHVLRFAPDHVIDSLLADLTGRGGFDDAPPADLEPESSAQTRPQDVSAAPTGAAEAAEVAETDVADLSDAPAPVETGATAQSPPLDESDIDITAEPGDEIDTTEALDSPAEHDEATPLEEAYPAGSPAEADDEPTWHPAEAEDDPNRHSAQAEDDPPRHSFEAEDDPTWRSAEVEVHPARRSAESEDSLRRHSAAAAEARELLDRCLGAAVDQQASGVHLLPAENGLQVDMRIDGELKRWQTLPREEGDELLAVVKEEALNIQPSESDSVQDGLINREIGGASVRFSVSILPIAGSFSEDRRESIVISILNEVASTASTLDALRLPAETLGHIRSAIVEPRGMVVLAGPSGSGRAATLNAILNEIVTPKVNVITLEESVTHAAQGVRQVRLNHKLDHEDALEAVRRHDPDVILVGELRTKETAELALKLANAGHLVFSRMPAHDTTGVVGRLFRLGVDPFLIAYAINLVVAQRLVQRLCPDCKQPAKHIDGELLRRLGFSRQEIASTKLYDEGVDDDCPTCSGTRYSGTQIIAEAMPFTHDTRRLIALADESLDDEDVRAHAVREGMATIRSSARDVVLSGETSVGEMIRVTAGAS